jgi:hypothetical protein
MGLRPLACWDCGFESPLGHGCLSLVIVVCCQVELSASDWSFIQRSPTECGVSECNHEASIMRRPWPTRGYCTMGGKNIPIITSCKILLSAWQETNCVSFTDYNCEAVQRNWLIAEVFPLPRHYAAWIASCLPTFRDNMPVPYSRVKQSWSAWPLKMGPIYCSRNIRDQLPTYATWRSRRA